jgi:hypothetical protein
MNIGLLQFYYSDGGRAVSTSTMAIFQQLKAEVRVWTWDWMYYNLCTIPRHLPVVPEEAEIASLIWRFEAVVDPMAYVFCALLPEGW